MSRGLEGSGGFDRARARRLLDGFAGLRLLVLGDLILDRYVWGSVDRISPEAPVPVVRVERESTMLGGAGNVARNALSLGAGVEMVAAIGRDRAASELARLFGQWKMSTAGLVELEDRPSTQKTRVIARGQQVVRYDRESDAPLLPEAQDRVLEAVREQLDHVDGVIVEDYAKGLLTPGLISEVMTVCARHQRPVFVDPKVAPWDVYRGAELVKPNLREAAELCGERVQGDATPEQVERLGRAVLQMSGARNVVVTRGSAGMTHFPGSGPTQHFPTRPHPVADLAGAGDTVIALIPLVRLAGGSWAEALRLANAAAGFVIGRPGTATLAPEDLLRCLEGAA